MAGSSVCVYAWMKIFPFCLDDTHQQRRHRYTNNDHNAAAAADYDNNDNGHNNDNIINLEPYSDREPMP